MKKIDVEALVRRVNGSEKSKKLLKICCQQITLVTVVVFIFLVFLSIDRSWTTLAGYLITLGVPFVLVTLMRKLINAPRPYEIYDFIEDPPRGEKGESFPSRHAFSIFAIGTVAVFFSPLLGTVTLLLGLLMCFCRVALGIHFVRDVLTGGLIGVATSIIGGLILFR